MRQASSFRASATAACWASEAAALCRAASLPRDHVGIGRVEQPIGDRLRVDPTGRLGDCRPRPVVELAVERGEPGCHRRKRIVVAPAGRNLLDEPAEADVAPALQRRRDPFQALGHADRIDQHEARLLPGVGRHLPQLGRRAACSENPDNVVPSGIASITPHSARLTKRA